MKKENNLNLTCHTRPDRVSRGMIFNNKELTSAGSSGRANACPRMTGETGRSMVEMLGVLAVMGVLSVGGVAMYTSAMNKHRANELLNEASKRAAIVAMQITSGKSGTGLSIDEFTQPSGYLFGVDTSYVAGGKTFVLTLSKAPNGNIDEAICTQMKNAAGNNGVMVVDPTCSKITVNADMSGGVSANMTPTPTSCTAEGKKWCSGNNKCVAKGTSCCTDVALNTCLTGCDSSNGTLTYAREGMQCDLQGTKDGVCLSGVCSEIPSTCDANHLPGCTDPDSCENVGGWWCDDNVMNCDGSSDCGRCMTPVDCYKFYCEAMDAEVPKDYEEIVGSSTICCKDGYESNGDDWVVSDVYMCGCPSGTEQGANLSKSGSEVCCQTDPDYRGFGGQVGDPDTEGWYPEACGCPSDAPTLTYYDSTRMQQYCCNFETGYGYDEDGRDSSSLCACPEIAPTPIVIDASNADIICCNMETGKGLHWDYRLQEDELSDDDRCR